MLPSSPSLALPGLKRPRPGRMPPPARPRLEIASATFPQPSEKRGPFSGAFRRETSTRFRIPLRPFLRLCPCRTLLRKKKRSRRAKEKVWVQAVHRTTIPTAARRQPRLNRACRIRVNLRRLGRLPISRACGKRPPHKQNIQLPGRLLPGRCRSQRSPQLRRQTRGTELPRRPP